MAVSGAVATRQKGFYFVLKEKHGYIIVGRCGHLAER